MVSKDFEIKNLGEYHDFYVQSDTLLLADVFNSLRNTCLKYMGLILPIFYLHYNLHGKQPQKRSK